MYRGGSNNDNYGYDGGYSEAPRGNYHQSDRPYNARRHWRGGTQGRGRGDKSYGRPSRDWGGRRDQRQWNTSSDHETYRREDNFAGVGREESPDQIRRGGCPRGLRGREIGMWHARRSQARKEQKEKKNRSVVHMDANKQKNIERLLDNLKQEEASSSAASSSRGPSALQARPDRTQWEDPASHFAPGLQSADQESEFKQPLQIGSKDSSSGTYATTSTSTFVYKSSTKDEDNVPDSWEQYDSSDVDVESEESFSGSSSSLNTFAVDVVQPTEDSEEEDEGNETGKPNVHGVVQLLRTQDDYPMGRDDADGDFSSYVTESLNPLLDREMQEKTESLKHNPSYIKMSEFRKKLPSFEMSQTIVDTINKNQVLVISGETGCGKTTQVPQFILDDYIQRGIGSQCRVVCTQPRRISAISVAERVAAERCENVNATEKSSVGYQIRLETKKPRTQGSILFCTTGIVLKMLERDPRLDRATHVIIDEIHERDLQSDFLMIILKDLLPRRHDLKVILMSATLNAEMFSQYFGKCPMLNIPGYTFPVKEYLLEDIIEMTSYNTVADGSRRRWSRKKSPQEMEMEQDYQVWCRNLRGKYRQKTIGILESFDFSQIDLELINHIINHICTRMEDGAILVFVPGWEEIKKLYEMIENTPRYRSGSLRVIPLHSLMPTVNQREIFDRPPPGVRKIVVATNIAETSITIDDVVFVVDCGKIKVKDFSPEMNLTSLEPRFVSKANAKQRRGRAGRVQAGYCFHLYTDFHYQVAQDYLPPEMLRTRLEELCLQIKLLKLGRIVPFISKAMQHPSMESVSHAVETLMELSALDANENLLPLGYHLARLPMEPHTGKMILFGAMFSCLDPILTVAASLSFKDAFMIPLGKEIMADQARKCLAMNSKSDHIMLINAFRGWEESKRDGSNRSYCWQNFLSENTLKLLKDMKKQLAELMYDIGFLATKNPKDSQANLNSANFSMIKAVLCAGLYPNVAAIFSCSRKSKKHKSLRMNIKDGSRVVAHPKSVNSNASFFESKWMVFYHKLKTSKVYIHDTTMVSPYPLLFFGGKIDIITEDKQGLVSVDDWVKFKATPGTARLVKDLRAQLDRVLTNKITKPGPTVWDKASKEGSIMTAIADLITTEVLGCGKSGDGSVGIPDD